MMSFCCRSCCHCYHAHRRRFTKNKKTMWKMFIQRLNTLESHIKNLQSKDLKRAASTTCTNYCVNLQFNPYRKLPTPPVISASPSAQSQYNNDKLSTKAEHGSVTECKTLEEIFFGEDDDDDNAPLVIATAPNKMTTSMQWSDDDDCSSTDSDDSL